MNYPLFGASQRGVGMIEVLVAVLVLSIGVLGYAGLQLRALNSTSESHFQTQASSLAQDAVERMMANEDMLDTYYANPANWPQGEMSNAPLANWGQCYQNICTQPQLAAWDVAQLRWLAWNLLPGGRISAEECSVSGVLCVTVAWGESTPADCDPSDDTCLVMEVLP
ncbi:MAG: type IV pilus modification protein PilV [Alcanivoracaceae bacterium]|jgi:type IV pilus assembly protein PilV|nr:type IV pilus modification protein PilV [Alcanivoracaceae bacterium]